MLKVEAALKDAAFFCLNPLILVVFVVLSQSVIQNINL